MRWSLFSLIALLTLLLISDVTALPAPQDGFSDLILEPRGKRAPRVSTKAQMGATKALKMPKKLKKQTKKDVRKDLRANMFKKASSTYRNAATKSKNPTFTAKNGKLVRSKNTGKILKGYDAGEYLHVGVREIGDHVLQITSWRHKR